MSKSQIDRRLLLGRKVRLSWRRKALVEQYEKILTQLDVDLAQTNDLIAESFPSLAETTVTPSSPSPQEQKASTTKKTGEPTQAELRQIPLGRNGRPKLPEAVAFLLDRFGVLHLDEITEKLNKYDLNPKSKKPRQYVSYTLARHPKVFEKAGGKKRGYWRVRGNYRQYLEVSDDTPPITETFEPPDVIEGIRSLRSQEREAGNHMSLDEAQQFVDEITTPKRLRTP